MCTVDLSAVAKVCGPNVPGNIELYVANSADVEAVPDPDANTKTISTDLTMVTGKYFYRYVFTKKTCQHKEDPAPNGQVIGFVEADFDHDDDAKRYLFEQMSTGEFDLIVVDGNELPKLVRAAEFQRTFDSGISGQDKNGYKARWDYEGLAANIYTGSIPEAP